MKVFLEKMGDSPAWMKIRKYREDGRRAELILGLQKKDYWFPVSPTVYKNFQKKIQESRLAGLRYLQGYIRRYRGYAERWPSKRYVRENKIRNSLLESVSSEVFRLFHEGGTVESIAEKTMLPEFLVRRLLEVSGKLSNMDQSSSGSDVFIN